MAKCQDFVGEGREEAAAMEAETPTPEDITLRKKHTISPKGRGSFVQLSALHPSLCHMSRRSNELKLNQASIMPGWCVAVDVNDPVNSGVDWQRKLRRSSIEYHKVTSIPPDDILLSITRLL